MVALRTKVERHWLVGQHVVANVPDGVSPVVYYGIPWILFCVWLGVMKRLVLFWLAGVHMTPMMHSEFTAMHRS